MIVLWIFTAAVSVWFVSGAGDVATRSAVAIWSPLVSQSIAFVILLRMLNDMAAGLRRFAWWMVMCALICDGLSDLGWIFFGASPLSPSFELSDIFGLLMFPFITAAGVVFFLDLGGSFRKWQVWLDIATFVLGLGAILWLFLLRPQLSSGVIGHADLLNSVVYSLGVGAMMIVALLLIMQVVDWRAERALLLLVGCSGIVVVIDLGWIGAQARDQYMSGSWFNIVGSCLPYALLGTAVTLERQRVVCAPSEKAKAGNSFNFLPIISVLIAIALLFGEKSDLHGIKGAALILFVLTSAVLVAARQSSVRKEVQRLYRAVAMREAEARLSELVRRSMDVIAVVDANHNISYASPAASKVLGVRPDALRDKPASRLLGPEHERRLDEFICAIGTDALAAEEMEAVLSASPGERRILRVIRSDQRGNPAIAGVVLTVSDVTDQRRLEREVIEIATRERERLSSDIHDGLGQELTGIALLLKSLNLQSERERGTLRRSVDMIADHVVRTVDVASRLATGLAPLQVGRGSLEQTLQRLAQDSSERYSMSVNFTCACVALEFDATESEHLYRIVQESINNAARHSGCASVDVVVRIDNGNLVMSITDDGVGLHRSAASVDGLGLRMVAYRARVLGGSMNVGQVASAGTCVSVTVPLPVPSGAPRVLPA